MSTKNCYILSIFLCLFLTNIPLHGVLDPKRLVPEKETTLSTLGKSFGGNAVGWITSAIIVALFYKARPNIAHHSDSYIFSGILSAFVAGSLANFCAQRYPKQTLAASVSIPTLLFAGAAICYTTLDLLPISNDTGFFTKYPPAQ